MSKPGSRISDAINGIIVKIYVIYRYEIYPSINNIRGTTRLADVLFRLSRLSVEKIETKKLERISDREWDNLIILDACRHDTYEKVVSKAEKRYSAGSMSQEYIEKNFSTGDWSDTVYITANLFLEPSYFKKETGRDPEDVFHEVFYTFQTDWDEDSNTVMPKSVMRDAKVAEKLFPNKRKIIHFMQPHYPFVGSEISSSSFIDSIEKETVETIWIKALRGEIEHDLVVDAYEDNLEFVMPYVEELAEDLKGKTAVTADHGNFLGEGGLYGHPPRSKAKVLHEVPWDVISED